MEEWFGRLESLDGVALCWEHVVRRCGAVWTGTTRWAAGRRGGGNVAYAELEAHAQLDARIPED